MMAPAAKDATDVNRPPRGKTLAKQKGFVASFTALPPTTDRSRVANVLLYHKRDRQQLGLTDGKLADDRASHGPYAATPCL